MKSDFFACALLIILSGLYIWIAVELEVPPSEDAAMLMRYADHVARGEGIVWNIGEAPVDGATDFLFMLIVALLHRIGLSLEQAVHIITIVSHFGAVFLIYFGMRLLQDAGIIPAILSAAYFAVGPGLFLSAMYFGTPFFALAIAVAWFCAQRIILSHRQQMRDFMYFSFACLLTGLIRPEGVIISMFMLAAIGAARICGFRRLVLVFGAIFIILGGAFFVWRWNYFGHPLPNPFYIKGGGHLYLDSLKRSIMNNVRLLFPFIPAFLLSMRNKKILRLGIAFMIPIAGSALMWIFLSDVMNFNYRFQYPLLPVALLSWFPLVKSVREDMELPDFHNLNFMKRLAAYLVALYVVVMVFAVYTHVSNRISCGHDGRYELGIMLSQYADRGYTIATSEAGLLPLYSKWRAVDTWGLNDKWIAHNGSVTGEYLRSQEPVIIMWHSNVSQLHLESSDINDSWSRMVVTLFEFAENNGYELAACFGVSPREAHFYYVRTDVPESHEIIEKIRNAEYIWYKSCERCFDYSRDYLFDKR